MALKSFLLLAPLCALLQLSQASPLIEAEAPKTINGKRGYFVEHVLSPEQQYCHFQIEDLEGWSTSFGLWNTTCDQLVHSFPTIHEVQHDTNHLHIDVPSGLVTLTSDYYGSFSCNAIVADSYGCDTWHHTPPARHGLAKRGLKPRQCNFSAGTVKHAPLDPVQTILHKQITQKLNCKSGGTGCSTENLSYKTYTLGFSLVSGTKVTEWISAGFDVSKAVTVGAAYTCEAANMQTVCNFAATTYTAYNVQNYVEDTCTGVSYSGVTRISSPGEHHINCGYGSTCGQQGKEYKSAP